jgi:death-on-curing protein
VQHFSYAKLEEATFYQYAYGDSNTLLPQAARFVSGFLKLRPLEDGNEATAFVGVVSFVRLNGRCLDLDDRVASAWFADVTRSRDAARRALDGIVHIDSVHHHDGIPDVRRAIQATLNDFPETIAALVSQEHAQHA